MSAIFPQLNNLRVLNAFAYIIKPNRRILLFVLEY